MKNKSKRSVISETKVIHSEVEKELKRLKKRMSVAHLSKATIIIRKALKVKGPPPKKIE